VSSSSPACNARAVADDGGAPGITRASLHGRTHYWSDAMSKLLRGVAAGYGAKKLGGGCFSTVLIFLVLWWVLGHFNVFR
jgi:hypothetical protein